MNVIYIDVYKKLRKRENIAMPLQDIVQEAQERTRGQVPHDLSYAEHIASRILQELQILNKYSGNEMTPIIQLLSELNFFVFNQVLHRTVCGYIYIKKNDTDLIQKYQNDHVVILNENEELGHARFVAAHELGHYIFEYDGIEEQFMNRYVKNAHSNHIEQICNRFAASVLMPKELFIKQYYIAKDEIDDISFIVYYLSKFFKTSSKSIEKRIREVF